MGYLYSTLPHVIALVQVIVSDYNNNYYIIIHYIILYYDFEKPRWWLGYEIYIRRIVVRSLAWRNNYLFYKMPSGFGFEFRWGAKEFLFSAPVHSGPGTHQAFPTTRTGSFPRVKRPGRGTDRLPPYGAEVKSDKNYTSTPLVCFLDMFQGDLYFLQNIQFVSGAHAAFCSMGSGASFSGLKLPGPHLLS